MKRIFFFTKKKEKLKKFKWKKRFADKNKLWAVKRPQVKK